MNRIGYFALLSAATLFPLAGNLAAEQQLDVKVPFAFSVANRNLPAGEYRIEHHGAFLSIENVETLRMTTVLVNPGERSSDGKNYVSFDEVNGVRFLRRVATPNAAINAELTASTSQKSASQAERQTFLMESRK